MCIFTVPLSCVCVQRRTASVEQVDVRVTPPTKMRRSNVSASVVYCIAGIFLSANVRMHCLLNTKYSKYIRTLQDSDLNLMLYNQNNLLYTVSGVHVI